MERTFVMIKPDGVQRGLIGKIIERFERKGLKIVALKMLKLSKELAKKQYEVHREKSFFKGLVNFVTSGPVVVMVVEGKNAIKAVRNLIGATDPLEAIPGTIRGDFGMEIGRNIIHASDSENSAKKEIYLFFNENEICEYSRIDEEWLYEN